MKQESYLRTRTFQNDSSRPIFTCKDENGTLKTDKQEVLDRWT